MKNRAPLLLIEQAIMLLVFALAAVLCIRAFVWSDDQSEYNTSRDFANLHAQNAAETLKSCGGDFSDAACILGGEYNGTEWIIKYDENWALSHNGEKYTLIVSPFEQEYELLGSAIVQVFKGSQCIASLTVCWQEVGLYA